MEIEKDIFIGTPSQKVNMKYFLLSLLIIPIPIILYMVMQSAFVLSLLIIPISWILVKVVQTSSIKIRITNQRMIISEGVFNRKTDELELYRVRDVGVEEPFFYRILGIGNVIVKSTDKTDPDILLKGFSKVHELKDIIRTNAEYYRQNRKWGTTA